MKFRKLISMMLAVFMLLTCLTGMVAADNAITESDGNMNLDVVFVIDASWSMNSSDPDGIAEEAAALFADMCDFSNCRFGYVIYSSEIDKEQSLVDLDDESAVRIFKNDLQKLSETENPTTAYSDLPCGLTEAKEILRLSDTGEDRKPLIVLLSDGQTTTDPAVRTLEEAEEELKNTKMELTQMGVPVYSIALHDPEYWEPEDAEELEVYMTDISDPTGGEMFAPNSAEELIDVNNKIFADFNDIIPIEIPMTYNSATGDYEGVIPIDNNSVCMANVVIMDADVSDPRMYRPNGDGPVTDDSITTMESDHYTVVKMMFPEMGDWTIRIAGYEGDAPKVSLLCAYSYTAAEELDRTTASVGDTVYIRSTLVDNSGATVTDEQLLNQLAAECVVANVTAGTETTVSLAYDSTMGWFTGEYQATEAGDFRFETTLHSSDNGFKKVSDPIVMQITDPVAPSSTPTTTTTTTTLDTVKTWRFFSKDVDMTSLTTSNLSYCTKVEGAEDIAEMTLSGTDMHIKGIGAGSAEIIAYGVADDGSDLILTGKVVVHNTLLLLLIPLFLILLVIAFLIVRSTWKLRGSFDNVDVNGTKVSEMGIPQKHCFSMYEVLDNFKKEVMDISEEELCEEYLKQYAKDLKAAKFTVNHDRISMQFQGTTYHRSGDFISWVSQDMGLSISFTYGDPDNFDE